MRSALIPVLFGQNDKLSFDLPLTSSLIPRLALGSPTPTFTRATTATFQDFEGLLKTTKAGEARFEGARRVENLVLNSQNIIGPATNYTITGPTVTNNAALSPDGTQTAALIGITAGGFVVSNTGTDNNFIVGDVGVFSVYLRSVSGSGTWPIRVYNGTTFTNFLAPLTTEWKRFTLSTTTTALTNSFNIYPVDTRVGGMTLTEAYVWGIQAEKATGQANQNPSEYVSTGVLPAPYHGAGVAGVKYFNTTNGNTVASNAVTEATGTAIPGVTLKGYLAEGARTNLLLNSAVPVTQSITTTAQAYTISMWGTGTCTLSGTGSGVLTGTGANDRVQLTVTATAGTLTLTFAGTNTKGQAEAGAFASSYIPTDAASVTRNADRLSYLHLNNLNLTNCSLFFNFKAVTSTYILGTHLFSLRNTTGNIPLYILGSTAYTFVHPGSSIPLASVPNLLNPNKVAVAFSTSYMVMAINNVLADKKNSVSPFIAVDDNFYIGCSARIASNNDYMYGTIKDIKFWKNALKDQKLIRLTQ